MAVILVLITCICMASVALQLEGGPGGGGGGKGAYPASACTYDSSMYNHNPSQACMIVYVVVLQNWIATMQAESCAV